MSEWELRTQQGALVRALWFTALPPQTYAATLSLWLSPGFNSCLPQTYREEDNAAGTELQAGRGRWGSILERGVELVEVRLWNELG